jgi:hypothetical protein
VVLARSLKQRIAQIGRGRGLQLKMRKMSSEHDSDRDPENVFEEPLADSDESSTFRDCWVEDCGVGLHAGPGSRGRWEGGGFINNGTDIEGEGAGSWEFEDTQFIRTEEPPKQKRSGGGKVFGPMPEMPWKRKRPSAEESLEATSEGGEET